MANQERLTYLFQKYLSKTYSLPEREELFQLINQAENDSHLAELINQTWNSELPQHEQDSDQAELIFRNIVQQQRKRSPVVRLWRYAAAAIITLLVGTSVYFLLFNNRKPAEIADTLPDVPAPAVNKAAVTLANGQKVYLDSSGNGQLAMQGNMQLVKLADGQIVYRESSIGNRELVYNTLTNPRGSKVIDMTLADGSHVWLNAGSSVTYPVAFAGNERKVTITGEAYFEVAHDAHTPFYVSNGDMQVQVLGTHFNVNAYDDEEVIKVTLLEGSVKVRSESRIQESEVVIKPGEQAVLIHGSRLTIDDNVDLEAVMAWKNGYFNFNRAGLPEIMRQIGRWYDVEVEYTIQPDQKHFSGILSRNSNVTDVLKIMERANVHFKIEGRKIKVME